MNSCSRSCAVARHGFPQFLSYPSWQSPCRQTHQCRRPTVSSKARPRRLLRWRSCPTAPGTRNPLLPGRRLRTTSIFGQGSCLTLPEKSGSWMRTVLVLRRNPSMVAGAAMTVHPRVRTETSERWAASNWDSVTQCRRMFDWRPSCSIAQAFRSKGAQISVNCRQTRNRTLQQTCRLLLVCSPHMWTFPNSAFPGWAR